MLGGSLAGWRGEGSFLGGSDLLRSFAQWSRASLSVLSKSRGPKNGWTQNTEDS